MAIEMTLRGIYFQRQLEIELMYKGHSVGKGRLDFLVEGKVKAVQQLAPIHTSQMVSYLSITGYPLGLMINFNVVALRQGIKRVAARPRHRR
jgi:GxxExxY protein